MKKSKEMEHYLNLAQHRKAMEQGAWGLPPGSLEMQKLKNKMESDRIDAFMKSDKYHNHCPKCSRLFINNISCPRCGWRLKK